MYYRQHDAPNAPAAWYVVSRETSDILDGPFPCKSAALASYGTVNPLRMPRLWDGDQWADVAPEYDEDD